MLDAVVHQDVVVQQDAGCCGAAGCCGTAGCKMLWCSRVIANNQAIASGCK